LNQSIICNHEAIATNKLCSYHIFHGPPSNKSNGLDYLAQPRISLSNYRVKYLRGSTSSLQANTL
jgi:hypothetical protein